MASSPRLAGVCVVVHMHTRDSKHGVRVLPVLVVSENTDVAHLNGVDALTP